MHRNGRGLGRIIRNGELDSNLHAAILVRASGGAFAGQLQPPFNEDEENSLFFKYNF